MNKINVMYNQLIGYRAYVLTILALKPITHVSNIISLYLTKMILLGHWLNKRIYKMLFNGYSMYIYIFSFYDSLIQ